MTKRGLQASTQGIAKANQALIRNNLNKTALARDLGLSRATVTNFFRVIPIERLNFEEICQRLGLNWQEIVDIPVCKYQTEEHQNPTSKNSDFVGREDAIASSLLENELDELVQKVRSLPDYSEKIQHLCGTMRMLDIAQPVRVDDIYINVNVLEELPSNKRNLEFS
ncbi:hypothetical protein LC608_29710 [Nostoc sp. XA010]|uniref:helix-turn-helix domain-containing protein n=1 Tax=Nostoc sp. XA010 TaxID=2780407 RepID=UPI001E4A1DD6|nr:hypothetical protein [Nostoc sp. XA010]MCC5661071.1 hypothetical protein [Nostoc sp. XA010]